MSHATEDRDLTPLTQLELAFPDKIGEMGRIVYRKEAMRYLGVSKQTLRSYERRGLLIPLKNIVNRRIFYTEDNVLSVLGSKYDQKREVGLYCRAAVLGSRSNKGNSAAKRLEDQVQRMSEYCVKSGIRVDHIIKDVGPVNGRVAFIGHDQLIDLIMRHRVSLLVVETEDRIARWGMGDMFKRFLEWHGVDLHVASPILVREEFKEELKQDLTELIYEARRVLGEI